MKPWVHWLVNHRLRYLVFLFWLIGTIFVLFGYIAEWFTDMIKETKGVFQQINAIPRESK